MDAILIVDMQVGLLSGPPKHDLQGILDRINQLTARVRERSGKVVWIQHCGGTGDDFRHQSDIVVQKTLNDAFAGTNLQETLRKIAADRVLIAGWATDFCVDATIRSAVSHDHHVVVVADGHTLSDRPHLDAPTVKRHHNWVWSNLISNHPVRVLNTAELL